MVQSECDNHLGRLVVHGKTWDRDSHGLFDYECNKITAATIKTNTSGVLVRVCKNPALTAPTGNQLIFFDSKEAFDIKFASCLDKGERDVAAICYIDFIGGIHV